MKYLQSAVAGLLLCSMLGAVQAESINERQYQQDVRIAKGVRSGALTHNEVQSLRSERREIRQTERQYRADGRFTQAERVAVRHDLNKLSRDIYMQKHDDDVRGKD